MPSTQNEQWRPVVGFEGYYDVSNLGRVKSVERMIGSKWGDKTKVQRERILKPGISNGYYKLTLCKEGKFYYRYVHRVVLESFDKLSDLVVDHIDENKLNNRLENLRYVTDRENNIHYVSKRKSKTSSKYIGVNYSPSHGKWRSAINVRAKRFHVGYFDNEHDAHLAYEAAKIKHNAV